MRLTFSFMCRTAACEKSVLTWAAPRAGNAAFANDFAFHIPDHWRFVNHGDAVPRVLPPPNLPVFEYKHAMKSVEFLKDGTISLRYCSCKDAPEQCKCLNLHELAGPRSRVAEVRSCAQALSRAGA